ncbi:hypothetical protein [Magnetovibrio sp.]|uniref:hypothetical protein n=1 Tax=Magnetovibrio sp. TaxID=2024836 RepID=UPI002F939655
MGGLTSSPRAPVAPAPVVVTDTTAEDETKLRMEALERRRRGRSGTILTSDRGLVTPNANAAQKKSLLGE